MEQSTSCIITLQQCRYVKKKNRLSLQESGIRRSCFSFFPLVSHLLLVGGSLSRVELKLAVINTGQNAFILVGNTDRCIEVVLFSFIESPVSIFQPIQPNHFQRCFNKTNMNSSYRAMSRLLDEMSTYSHCLRRIWIMPSLKSVNHVSMSYASGDSLRRHHNFNLF